jgi:hypothetical protein
VKSFVAGQLKMQAGREQVALLRGHDPSVFQRRKHDHLRPWRLQEWCADEDRSQRRFADLRNRQVGLEAAEEP